MANAARLLLALLTDWEIPPRKSPGAARQGDVDTMEFWEPHQRAVTYLREIEEGLDELERQGHDVAHYREILPPLYKAVFGLQPRWGAPVQAGGPVIRVEDERVLKALAGHLDVTHREGALQPEARAQLSEAVQNVRQLIADAEYLSASVRAYLSRLVDQLARTLEFEEDFATRTAAHQLAGALLETGAQSSTPDDKKGAWANAAMTIATGVMTHSTIRALEAAASAWLGISPPP